MTKRNYYNVVDINGGIPKRKYRSRRVPEVSWSDIDGEVIRAILEKRNKQELPELRLGKFYTFRHREKGIIRGRLVFLRDDIAEIMSGNDTIHFSLNYAERILE